MSMQQILIGYFIEDIKESAEKYAANKNDADIESDCLREACEVLIEHIDLDDMPSLLKRLSHVDCVELEQAESYTSEDNINLIESLEDAVYDLTNIHKHSVSTAWGYILQPIVHVLHISSENMSEAKKAMSNKLWMDA